MIREVLRVIYDDGLVSKRDVSKKSGVQESTLDRILSLLLSKGYLEVEEKFLDLPRGCMGCPFNSNCMMKNDDGKVYLITEKGRKLL